MRRLSALLLILSMTVTLAGCGGRSVNMPEDEAAEQPPAVEASAPTPTTEAESPVEAGAEDPSAAAVEIAPGAPDVRDLLAGMTLEEKVGQLFFVRCPNTGAEEKIARYHLGGVLLFTRDYKDAFGGWLTREAFAAKLEGYQDAARSGAGIPLFIGSDEEGGTVTRATRNPNLFADKLPSPQRLYERSGLTGLLADTKWYNERLLAYGVNVNFAPVCDVSTNPGDFIYDRGFGQDAEATADYIAQVVRVMGDAGIGSVLKHFPGYGNNVDTHTGVAIDERPYSTFEESDFLPFAAGVDAGAPFVLVSHNVVKCMDADFPASLSPVVHEILRNELGFDGVILTDDLAMDAVKAYAEDGSVAVLALKAGNDMIVTTDFEAQIKQVLAAVRDGTLGESLIDEACARVLGAKLRLGLLGE